MRIDLEVLSSFDLIITTSMMQSVDESESENEHQRSSVDESVRVCVEVEREREYFFCCKCNFVIAFISWSSSASSAASARSYVRSLQQAYPYEMLQQCNSMAEGVDGAAAEATHRTETDTVAWRESWRDSMRQTGRE